MKKGKGYTIHRTGNGYSKAPNPAPKSKAKGKSESGGDLRARPSRVGASKPKY